MERFPPGFVPERCPGDPSIKGGIVHADFFGNEASVDGDRRVQSTAELSEVHPSTLYHFSEEQIERLAAEVGLEVEDITYVPDTEVRFTKMRVPG